MATLTFRELAIPEAERLAGLAGIWADLQSVTQMCDYYLELFDDSPRLPHGALIDAFGTAIVIRYMRAFSEGVRLRLDREAIETLSPEKQTFHVYIKDLRDKHIAHSVNAFEGNAVTAHFWEDKPEVQGVISIGFQTGQQLPLSRRDVELVRENCRALFDYLKLEQTAEQERLLPIAQAIPFDVLKALPVPTVGVKDRSLVAKRRKSF